MRERRRCGQSAAILAVVLTVIPAGVLAVVVLAVVPAVVLSVVPAGVPAVVPVGVLVVILAVVLAVAHLMNVALPLSGLSQYLLFVPVARCRGRRPTGI